jgi:hypothetical protein
MIALSVLDDKPPNALQPPLARGIHIRWASSREAGFPWGGYYLFRREHIAKNFTQHRACIREGLFALWKSARATKSLVFDGGKLSSDINFTFVEPLRASDTVGLDLTGNRGIWFSANPGDSIWRALLLFYFQENAEIEIRTYFGERLVGQIKVKGKAGKRSTVPIEFSAITRLQIGAGPASLLELCVDPVNPGATQGWESIDGAPTPFALPVTNPDYPCSRGAEYLWFSRAKARGRIRYGNGPDAIPDPTPIWSLGTLVLKANSSIVLGNGTGWDQKFTGASLQVAGEPAAYIIAAVLSPEKLVLNRRYCGASNINASYAISEDSFSQLHDALMLLVNGGPQAGPMGSRLLPESIDEQGTLILNHQSLLVQGVDVNWSTEFAGLALYVGRNATGVVLGTTGEARVLGESTAFDGSFVGLDIQIETDRYTIIEVKSETELKLDRPFESETGVRLPFSLWEKTPYTIRNTSATELLLDRPYDGPSGSGIPYAIRYRLQSSGAIDTRAAAPILAPQRALGLVNLASLQPAIAEALGLAWIDNTVDPDEFYDYLIVASPFAKVVSAKGILSRIRKQHFSDLDGFIVFNVSLQTAAAPLSPPDDAQVFALPGAKNNLVDSSNNAGLRWRVSAPESALTSSSAIFFHLWRADFGQSVPELSSEMPEYHLLTAHPLLVSTPGLNLKLAAPSSTEWPPFSMLKVDSSLPDGWYSYQVSGIDIFGRHSKNSHAAQWRQWRPPPQPAPWYFNPDATNDVVHPFAIHLLDKIPPPPPTAIEAFALDPRDPNVVRDAPYQRWRESLPIEVRDELVGLRVRWRWAPSQMQQAPDLKEFRLHLEPGPMNTRMGRILRVTFSERGESWVETNIEHNESDQAFVGAWLRAGGQAFLVLESKSASPLNLTVRHIGPDRETAPRVGGCAVVIPPLFSLGTVSVEHGSMGVTGAGTRWHAGLIGMKLKVSNEIDLYPIGSVADAEHLTLGQRYKGTSAINKLFSVQHPLFVDYSDPIRWQERIFVVPAEMDWTPATDEPGALQYEVFLPQPDDLRSLLGPPSLADPIIYAHVGITAADHQSHTSDDPHWDSHRWGRRSGNESQLGARVTVFRVLREPPAVPVPPPDSERVYASAADYHGRSFYTYRWRPVDGLRIHIFRALDDTIFNVDWELRQPPRPLRSALDAMQVQFFPAALVEPRWNTLKRRQVADELNHLNTVTRDADGKAQAMAYYRALSNDALRILAGLPGNERAFSQITSAALDPEEPDSADPTQRRWRNRLGPDNPDDFAIDRSLCVYTDILNGRSTARYLYRSAHVDGAHNRSELSLSGPPVWLKDVVPPRTPVFTSVLAGPHEKEITLRWANSAEPDLAEYRIYRADIEDATRYLRLMQLIHTVRVPADLPAEPSNELSWTDQNVPALRVFYYRLVATDETGNMSEPSSALAARAFDEDPPVPPVPAVAWIIRGSNSVAQITWNSEDETQLQRQETDRGIWADLGKWRASGSYSLPDSFADPSRTYRYRLIARKSTGAIAIGLPLTLAPLSP